MTLVYFCKKLWSSSSNKHSKKMYYIFALHQDELRYQKLENVKFHINSFLTSLGWAIGYNYCLKFFFKVPSTSNNKVQQNNQLHECSRNVVFQSSVYVHRSVYSCHQKGIKHLPYGWYEQKNKFNKMNLSHIFLIVLR